MSTLREIKLRIGAIGKIEKIANALEVVSLTRLKRIEAKTERARHYFNAIRELAFDISNNLVYEAHPFFRPRKEIKKSMAILVTSDKGLCGDFNTNIEKGLKALLAEKTGTEVVAISIGRKGTHLLRRRGINIIGAYNSSIKDIDYIGLSSEITKSIAEKFLTKEINGVVIIYNQFKRQFLGKARRLQILPLKFEGFKVKRVKDYIYEPSPYIVLDALLREYIANQIGQVILESNAAEEMARMLAMKQARDNADELIGVLNLSYHKQRQMQITRELIDIATAANA